MKSVLIAGASMTRFGKSSARNLADVAREAVFSALKDAEVSTRELDRVYFSNAIAGLITGQEMIRGQVALRDFDIDGIPVINVENACASGSTAVHLGWEAVSAGLAETVLIVGAEKMTHEDKAVSHAAIGTATDVDRFEEAFSSSEARDIAKSRSPFMDLYARLAGEYLGSSDATVRDLADVAVKNRRHGALNPRAQYDALISADDVLGSRMIADPLTLYMCSPVGNGAAAIVLRSEEAASHMSRSDLPFIRASTLVSGKGGRDLPTAQVRAAQRAYEQAGLGPDDIDVAEVHDATAVGELIAYEELGFAPRGGGAELLQSGATQLGGRLCVNPSGGLLSRGHPIGATGVAQIVELTEQLRGSAGDRQVTKVHVALAANEGGWLVDDVAAAAVHIITRNPAPV